MESTNNTNSKSQIISNAIGLIKEKGYDKVSIVDICKASDITRTTFYYHFQGKEDLIEEYYQNLILNQQDMFSALFRLDNDLERYIAIVEKLISILMDEGPEFGKLVLRSILSDDRILQTFFVKDEWCIPLLTNCQKNHLIRTDIPPEELDQLIINVTLGLCFQWCASDGKLPLQDSVRSAIRQVLVAD